MTSGFDERRRDDATQLGQPVNPQGFPPSAPGYPDAQPHQPNPPVSQPYQQAGQPYPPAGSPPYPAYGAGRPAGPNTVAIVLVALAVVVALAGVVAIVVLVSGADDSTSASGASSSTASAPATSGLVTTTAADAVETTASQPAGGPVNAVVPGYRAIPAAKYKGAYDVPGNWRPVAVSPVELAGVSAVAVESPKYCSTSAARNISYLVTQQTSDTAAAATSAGRDAAREGYRATSPQSSPPVELKASSGNLKGSYIEFSGPWQPRAGDCAANRFSVYTFAVELEKGNCAVLVIMADRGTAGELDEVAAKRILTSLRSV